MRQLSFRESEFFVQSHREIVNEAMCPHHIVPALKEEHSVLMGFLPLSA
jgi:hypothetical protein